MKTFYFGFCLSILLLLNSRALAQNLNKIDSLQKLINTPKTADTTLIKAYNDLGIQHATSNPILAKQNINKALRIAHKIKKPRGIAGANNCLGVVYYYQKEYDSALVYFNKAYKINTEMGHSWGQASALHQIGVVQNHLNKYSKAIKSFQKAGKVFKSLNDSLSYIKTIENIGVSYNLMKYQKKGLERFLSANTLYKQLHNTSGIGRTYIHISQILIKQKEYEKALSYLKKSLPHIHSGGNKRHLSVVLNNIGISQRGLKNYDDALAYLQKSLALRKEKGNSKTVAVIQSEIGNTYFEMESYVEALHYQKKALQNYSIKGSYRQKATSYNSIARSFLKLNQIDSAKSNATKALSSSKKASDLETETEANQTLASIAEREENSLAAYQHFKNLSILKDSLKIIKQEEVAKELYAKYETKQKEYQINILQQLNNKIKQRYTILVSALILAMALLTVGLLVFIKKIKHTSLEKEILDRELDTKKKELTTHSLHLVKKNKVLESLKEEVEHIRCSEDQNAQFNYLKLIQTINFDLSDDTSWENFKRSFEQVHKDFYSIIKSKYPNVTSNELRLMALLKINLSSKEIASILNITQEGVRKARYRLRKKLDIPSNKMLMDMILNI